MEIIKCEFDFTLVATGDWFPCDNWFSGKLHYLNDTSLYRSSQQKLSFPLPI